MAFIISPTSAITGRSSTGVCPSAPSFKTSPWNISAHYRKSRTLRVHQGIDTAVMPPIPLVGSKAPNVSGECVHQGEIKPFDLNEYRGKYVVLFFWPLDFTFVCPSEITAFDDRYDDFRNLGAEVIGVSVDSVFCHLAWTQKERREGGLGNIQYPLVSDLKREASTNFGILSTDGVALRGLYIIDPDGIVQSSVVNNLSFGRSIDETLRLVEAIKYVREHDGEVVPCNWQPGKKTIRPTPELSQEYFKSLD
eukprot:Rmarinus@m.29366